MHKKPASFFVFGFFLSILIFLFLLFVLFFAAGGFGALFELRDPAPLRAGKFLAT